MAKRTAALLPSTELLLAGLGERIGLARLRRRLPAKQVAQRAGMSVNTLRAVEKGYPGVTLGAYAAVLQVLGLDSELAALVREDPIGRALQDSRPGQPLFVRRRRTLAGDVSPQEPARRTTPGSGQGTASMTVSASPSRAPKTNGSTPSGAVDTEALMRLLQDSDESAPRDDR